MFDVFAEGTKEKQEGRQYITFVDFPVPVPVSGRGMYVKRCRLVVDVTGRGLAEDADQSALEEWSNLPTIVGELQQSCWEYSMGIAESEAVQQEAQAWLGAAR